MSVVEMPSLAAEVVVKNLTYITVRVLPVKYDKFEVNKVIFGHITRATANWKMKKLSEFAGTCRNLIVEVRTPGAGRRRCGSSKTYGVNYYLLFLMFNVRDALPWRAHITVVDDEIFYQRGRDFVLLLKTSSHAIVYFQSGVLSKHGSMQSCVYYALASCSRRFCCCVMRRASSSEEDGWADGKTAAVEWRCCSSTDSTEGALLL